MAVNPEVKMVRSHEMPSQLRGKSRRGAHFWAGAARHSPEQTSDCLAWRAPTRSEHDQRFAAPPLATRRDTSHVRRTMNAIRPTTIHDTRGLIGAGLLDPADEAAIDAVATRYAVAITPTMRDLIEAPDDPIGRQFIPDALELVTAAGEHPDPIGDDRFSPVKGVVHRYADRALLKPVLICPVYCRFCFRREHVGSDGGLLTEAELDAAFAWFEAHPAISEIILTGGDPLMLSPRRLGLILARLAAMPHIATLRIHTRVPTADPARIDAVLIDAMSAAPRAVVPGAAMPGDAMPGDAMPADRPLWLVLHANHAREFTPAARAALTRLRRAGISLLGQSVLLRGVNDSADALEALFRAMLAAGVKPYYLHQLDAAPGTARFHVPIDEGRRLLASLRGRVTGLAWPTYVLDIPGGHGKVPIGPEYLLPDGAVRDPAGVVRRM
jgi:lysine 2,3-aminomutase